MWQISRVGIHPIIFQLQNDTNMAGTGPLQSTPHQLLHTALCSNLLPQYLYFSLSILFTPVINLTRLFSPSYMCSILLRYCQLWSFLFQTMSFSSCNCRTYCQETRDVTMKTMQRHAGGQGALRWSRNPLIHRLVSSLCHDVVVIVTQHVHTL